MAYVDKAQVNKKQIFTRGEFQIQSGGESTFQFVDNRPEAVAQQKLQEMANNSPQTKQTAQFKVATVNPSTQPIQKMAIEEEELLQGKFQPIQKKVSGMSALGLDDIKPKEGTPEHEAMRNVKESKTASDQGTAGSAFGKLGLHGIQSKEGTMEYAKVKGRKRRDAISEGQIMGALDISEDLASKFEEFLAHAGKANSWSKKLSAVGATCALYGAVLGGLGIASAVVVASGGTAIVPFAAAIALGASGGVAGAGAKFGMKLARNKELKKMESLANSGPGAIETVVDGGELAIGLGTEIGSEVLDNASNASVAAANAAGSSLNVAAGAVGGAGAGIGVLMAGKSAWDAYKEYNWDAVKSSHIDVHIKVLDVMRHVNQSYLELCDQFPPNAVAKYEDRRLLIQQRFAQIKDKLA